ncbi:MAG: helix-turn-helix transcriptional regulator [Pirellulales bacterium]
MSSTPRIANEATQVFASNLREIMSKRGLTVTELARTADVDRAGLSKLINGSGGSSSIATASKLADALEVDLWRLFKPKSQSSHHEGN